MSDQATDAVDPMEKAMSLIANSEEESDELEDDEQLQATEDEGEESEDGEDTATEETPAVVIEFAGNKFEVPEGTPPELVGKVQEIGKNLQADYTRKTQELVSRETQAAEIVKNDLEQGRRVVATAIEQAKAVILAVGGFYTPQQMAQLAETDPQEWIRQNARQTQLSQYLGELQQHQQMLDEQSKQADAKRIEAAKQQAWQRLNAEGINHEALQKTWQDAKSVYSFLTDERLSQVLDAESWLVLRDAIAFRQLKAQKPAATKQVAEAPKLPVGKKPMSKDDRARLDARKAVSRKGGASMRDLASFIATNSR